MSPGEKKRIGRLRTAAAAVFFIAKGLFYFLSFLGPALLLARFRWLPVPVLLALALAGIALAGFTFVALLVLTKRFLIGPIRTSGVVSIENREVKRWFLAAMLPVMLETSPFRSMVLGLSPLSPWYFRGMGTIMGDSVLIGIRTRIPDPWFLELRDNVNIGGDVLILGHLGHGKEIIHGRVVIGEGTVLGVRATIFPDVCIGRNARIAAGAVVTRGSVIPDGETWGGVPARLIGGSREG